MITVRFDRGNVVVESGEGILGSSVFPAYRYGDVLQRLRGANADFRDEASEAPPCPHLESSYDLRDYQFEAVEAWARVGCKGIIVLPTGAGKTVVAIKAAERLQASTLIVVPTLVLVEQWRETLQRAFKIPVGSLGGGSEDIRPVTVSTYDSAALRAGSLGNRFSLIIFDEVHHLPAQMNRRIATAYIAPYRLGLTATLGEDDEALGYLVDLVGKVVYEKTVDELAGRHLSGYTVRTVQLPLTSEEKAEYESQYSIYRDFLRRRGLKIRSPMDYLRFVRSSGVDPEARRALLARNTAMDIALNSGAKIQYLSRLLESNPASKTIIFTRHNKLVYRISRDLLIPSITHQTGRREREDILSRFRDGTYRRIVTSQVLDEGVDVPDASVAVILSGTGSSREFIQRLGRILRRREGKEAVLFELVSQDTAETRMSRRRKGD